MGDLFKLSQRQFTLKEANELLPVLRRITAEAVEQYQALVLRLEHLESHSRAWRECEGEIEAVLERWNEKVAKLGCEPKGIWLVDFDNGKGYYCWRYNETAIGFFHAYDSGFAGRQPIQ